MLFFLYVALGIISACREVPPLYRCVCRGGRKFAARQQPLCSGQPITCSAVPTPQGEVTERLLDRLEDCRRSFPVAAIIGGAGTAVAERLTNGRAGVATLLHIDDSPAMLARARRLQEVWREKMKGIIAGMQ